MRALKLFAFLALLVAPQAAYAADIQVLTTDTPYEAEESLAKQFTAHTGIHIILTRKTSKEIRENLQKATTADIVVGPSEDLGPLSREGSLIIGTTTPLGTLVENFGGGPEYAAAIAANSKNAGDAQKFIDFLTQPSTGGEWVVSGIDPFFQPPLYCKNFGNLDGTQLLTALRKLAAQGRTADLDYVNQTLQTTLTASDNTSTYFTSSAAFDAPISVSLNRRAYSWLTVDFSKHARCLNIKATDLSESFGGTVKPKREILTDGAGDDTWLETAVDPTSTNTIVKFRYLSRSGARVIGYVNMVSDIK